MIREVLQGRAWCHAFAASGYTLGQRDLSRSVKSELQLAQRSAVSSASLIRPLSPLTIPAHGAGCCKCADAGHRRVCADRPRYCRLGRARRPRSLACELALGLGLGKHPVTKVAAPLILARMSMSLLGLLRCGRPTTCLCPVHGWIRRSRP